MFPKHPLWTSPQPQDNPCVLYHRRSLSPVWDRGCRCWRSDRACVVMSLLGMYPGGSIPTSLWTTRMRLFVIAGIRWFCWKWICEQNQLGSWLRIVKLQSYIICLFRVVNYFAHVVILNLEQLDRRNKFLWMLLWKFQSKLYPNSMDAWFVKYPTGAPNKELGQHRRQQLPSQFHLGTLRDGLVPPLLHPHTTMNRSPTLPATFDQPWLMNHPLDHASLWAHGSLLKKAIGVVVTAKLSTVREMWVENDWPWMIVG